MHVHPLRAKKKIGGHRRSQDFRGWVRPGMDAGFLVRGDDGGAEGPERGADGGLGRGTVAPSPRMGSGA